MEFPNNQRRLLQAALAAMAITAACKPSAQEVTERAAQMEAAERKRALEAKAKREAAAARQAAENANTAATAKSVSRAADSDDGALCAVTADRARERMASCGLKVDDISPQTLCETLGRPKLAYLASRDCTEIEMMLAGGD